MRCVSKTWSCIVGCAAGPTQGFAVRSSIVKNVLAGGLPYLFKVYNEMFFGQQGGPDFRNGITLNVPDATGGQESLVMGELGMLLQDLMPINMF